MYFQDRKFSLSFQGTIKGHFGHWEVEKETNVKHQPLFHSLIQMQNHGVFKALAWYIAMLQETLCRAVLLGGKDEVGI